MTVTLVLPLASHLSMQTTGPRSLFCGPPGLLLSLALEVLQDYRTPFDFVPSFRQYRAPYASHKRRMPVPHKRENKMRFRFTAYRSKMPVPPERDNITLLHQSTQRCRMPVPSKRENTPPSTMLVELVANTFPKPAPIVLPMSRLAEPKPT